MPKNQFEFEKWWECYVAAISSGRSTRAAIGIAGESMDNLRNAIEAMGVHEQAAA